MKGCLLKAAIGAILIATVTGCGKAAENLGREEFQFLNTEVSSQEIVTEEVTQEEITSEETTTEGEEASIPESYMIKAENYFDYQSGLECSAFASAYVLRHYGEEADGIELFKTFPQKNADGSGAPPYGILTFFEERGYEAKYQCDGTIEDLKREISKGAPVIVFIHVAEPYTTTHNTHYLPAVGYDSEYFYFAESLLDFANCKEEKNVPYNRKTEISKFQRLWSDIDGFWDYPYFIISKKL